MFRRALLPQRFTAAPAAAALLLMPRMASTRGRIPWHGAADGTPRGHPERGASQGGRITKLHRDGDCQAVQAKHLNDKDFERLSRPTRNPASHLKEIASSPLRRLSIGVKQQKEKGASGSSSRKPSPTRRASSDSKQQNGKGASRTSTKALRTSMKQKLSPR
jgi:hypothetical protein